MKIAQVSYITEYVLRVVFDDGKEVSANFEKFITTSPQPMTNQFKDIERFRKVYVENGHLTWEDGQMDISSHSIREGAYKQ